MHIGIIGGGLSGTLVAINLLRLNTKIPFTIYLIEKGKSIGKGVAYSTEEDLHLLNVPAGKMGAYANKLGDFYQWLQTKDYKYSPDDFVPRKLYGIYINEVLEKEIATRKTSAEIKIINDEAIDITPIESGAIIKLKNTSDISVEKLVLAFGNFPPANPRFVENALLNDERYYSNPWAVVNFDAIKEYDSVLLIGAGLTMVDMVINLHKKNHQGKITVISNHGYKPFAHKKLPDYPSFYDELKNKNTVYDLYYIIKKHIKIAEANNSGWRAVIASLRPHTQTIWQSLNIGEQRKFLKHFKSLWEVVRHRIAPKAEGIISLLSSTGQFQVIGAKILNVGLENSRIKVDLKRKKAEEMKNLYADHVLNCTGPQSNYERNPHPLIQSLMTKGILQNDPLNIGIQAIPKGNLISRDGAPSDIFYTIGPSLKGTLWECTAAPEIKDQAYLLAKHIVKNL